jgi:hypothetical protein
MALDKLRRAIEDALDDESHPDLSVWGENGYTAAEVCQEARRYLRHGKVRESTVGAVQGTGLLGSCFRSEPWPHVTLRFDHEPTDIDLEALIAVFGAPYRNPAREA